jgi:hypothetical protein
MQFFSRKTLQRNKNLKSLPKIQSCGLTEKGDLPCCFFCILLHSFTVCILCGQSGRDSFHLWLILESHRQQPPWFITWLLIKSYSWKPHLKASKQTNKQNNNATSRRISFHFTNAKKLSPDVCKMHPECLKGPFTLIWWSWFHHLQRILLFIEYSMQHRIR